jgi:acyl-CoA thioesterase II
VSSALERLLRLFELERLDQGLFLGNPGRGQGRLFGGLVAAQSVIATCRTVEDRQLHSLHAYFIRPGRHDVPIRYVVDPIRDGRTFATRHVIAYQGGEAIFDLSCSFTAPEDGIQHQDTMPEAPPPDGLPEWHDQRSDPIAKDGSGRREPPVLIRVCDPDVPGLAQPASRRLWIKPNGTMPEDPLLHTALLVYASDRTLLSTAGRPHGLAAGKRVSASLDHALWMHRPARFDDWVLYTSESPVAFAARGLIHGAMYSTDGVRIASVTQEGLIRIPREG